MSNEVAKLLVEEGEVPHNGHIPFEPPVLNCCMLFVNASGRGAFYECPACLTKWVLLYERETWTNMIWRKEVNLSKEQLDRLRVVGPHMMWWDRKR